MRFNGLKNFQAGAEFSMTRRFARIYPTLVKIRFMGFAVQRNSILSQILQTNQE